MSFFDKLKSGVADAGNKAKTAIEVNRLRMQNNSKRKEIDQIYMEMGKLAFLSFTGRGEGFDAATISPFSEKVLHLEVEIKANLQQMKTLSDEQDCVCGKVVPLNVRFCTNCGHEFSPIDESGADV